MGFITPVKFLITALKVGLALVKAVAEAHKGRIEVESSAKKGTSFIIILPKDFRKIKLDKKAPEVQQPLQH